MKGIKKDNVRRYFIVKLPKEQSKKTLDVCIGLNETQRFSNNGNSLYVKTTQELIDKELKKGMKFKDIFPPNLTTEYTYLDVSDILQGNKWNEEI